jgi:Holliday junction DNA helicase RuvB
MSNNSDNANSQNQKNKSDQKSQVVDGSSMGPNGDSQEFSGDLKNSSYDSQELNGDLTTSNNDSQELSGDLTSLKEIEPKFENQLRPKSLDEFVGQIDVKNQLNIILKAALERESSPDHILLSGPPGLGKTTLSMLISLELQKPLKITSGPAIQHSGDLAAILSSLQNGEVLFIDEIHRLAKPVQEMLYVAMEDFRVDVVVGKGPGATAIPLEIPPFVAVGATTRSGLLPAPLRDRFGFVAQLEYYDIDELSQIIMRSAKILKVQITGDAALELASRSRGTPRIANRLLNRTRDYNQIHNKSKTIDVKTVIETLNIYKIDEYGLDKLDRLVLKCLVENNKPLSLSTIAAYTGEEIDTIESVVEPYLMRAGLLTRTPRGRVASPEGYKYIKSL